jgi:AcrB/AcrD/AcrF family
VSETINGVEELRKQLEPDDVHIVAVLDRSDLVTATVSKIGHTLLEGIGLVIVVLVLFLGSPRSALVVAVTIPLAVVSIFVLMNAAHMSASMLSLGALDFGVIVDGAIVVTENILRRREAKPTEELTEEDVRSATSQVARPILFATLIIITAYFPLFTLQRGEAALFTPMAYTVGFCAVRGALVHPRPRSPACLHGISQTAPGVPQPAAGMVGKCLPNDAGVIAELAHAFHTLRLERRSLQWGFSALWWGETTSRIWTRARSGSRSSCRAVFRSTLRLRWRASFDALCENSRKSAIS